MTRHKPFVHSVRLPGVIAHKVDRMIEDAPNFKNRQEYYYNLIIKDLQERGVIRFQILPRDRFEEHAKVFEKGVDSNR